MRIKVLFSLILLLLTSRLTAVFAQFNYRKVPAALLQSTSKGAQIQILKRGIFKDAVNLTKYLPHGYAKTGTVDYTEALQQGINAHKEVLLPDFPVLINSAGLILHSDLKVLFQENSQLILQPNAEELYGMIYIENIQNVAVYFADLVGDRHAHQTSKGEWGMGVFIRHSENILVENATISNLWGDGIYIGNIHKPSSNIVVRGARIDSSRRNGISIIAGDGITIENCIISNTAGTSPEFGIDIEPNKPDDQLRNIILADNITFNNKAGGLLFAFDNLQDSHSATPNVEVFNHQDYYSPTGIEFYIDRGYRPYVRPQLGRILIKGANFYRTAVPLKTHYSSKAEIDLQISRIRIDSKNIPQGEVNNFVEIFKRGRIGEIR